MKFCTVRELRINPNKVLRQARRQRIVVTVRGRPMATIASLREEDFEGLILDDRPELRRSVYAALEEVKKTGGVPLAEVKRRLKIRV